MIKYSSPFLDKFVAEIAKRNIEILPMLRIENGARILPKFPTYQATIESKEHIPKLIDVLLEKSPNGLQFANSWKRRLARCTGIYKD